MGISYTTFAEWVEHGVHAAYYGGRGWKIVVAAGAIIAGSALYWYERDDPRYPAAQDYANLIAACAERQMVIYGYPTDSNQYGVVSGTTNAVGYYPEYEIVEDCAAAVRYALSNPSPISEINGESVFGGWADCSPNTGVVNAVEAWVDGRTTWNDYVSRWITPIWFTNNFENAGGAAYTFLFETNSEPHYPIIADLETMAKMISAMRIHTISAIITNATIYDYASAGTGATWQAAYDDAWANLSGPYNRDGDTQPTTNSYGALIPSNPNSLQSGSWVYIRGWENSPTQFESWVSLKTCDITISIPFCAWKADETITTYFTVSVQPPSSSVFLPVGLPAGVSNGVPFLLDTFTGTNPPSPYVVISVGLEDWEQPEVEFTNLDYRAGWGLGEPFGGAGVGFGATAYPMQYLTNAAAFWPEP